MLHASLRLFHVIGIMLIFFGFGGMLLLPRLLETPPRGVSLGFRLCNSLGLVLILGTGLGMLGDLGLLAGDPPNWSKVKIVLLVALGAFTPLARRKVGPMWAMAAAFMLLAVLSAYLGIFKPF